MVLLNSNTIFVIEFKIGATSHDSDSRWQAGSYARDLRDFHKESNGRRIVPILCATNASEVPFDAPNDGFATGVTDLVRSTGSDLGFLLRRWNLESCSVKADPIKPCNWLDSPYRPTQTIIEAATSLYEGHGVREISHSYAHNLDRTTEMLLEQIRLARECGRRVVCFVTGVPGAGKTLTGLNVIHDPGLSQSQLQAGIFLSGNGPLVKIVREALVKNQVSKGRKVEESRREAETFIQNVHNFLRYHLERTSEFPHENVVVFDEAQRAWNSQQMNRKQRIARSEADLLFEVMERLPKWAVIVALVGGGQEIHVGEAGLQEWGRALEARCVPWRVVASPEALEGGDSVAGHKLFDGPIPENVVIEKNPVAHLDVVVRSHRAQRWAEWVNKLLELSLDEAAMVFPDSEEFPCFVTRDLDIARSWLRNRHSLDPEDRIGLIATSQDQRLRAYGLERSSAFRLSFPFEKWYLEQAMDIRSSYTLEVAASEFECQGLELDWVGLCWGGDLIPKEECSAWDYRKFRGGDWNYVRSDAERQFTLNRYRVLLTRARRGLVIWVPKGDPLDPTRDPQRFNKVFNVLREAGVPMLDTEW